MLKIKAKSIASKRLKEELPKIKVLTVDSAQGTEHDVSIISLVRTGFTQNSFIEEERRYNVMASMARRGRIFVVNLGFAKSSGKLKKVNESHICADQ